MEIKCYLTRRGTGEKFSQENYLLREIVKTIGHRNIIIAIAKPCLGYAHYLCHGMMHYRGEVDDLFLEASAIDMEEHQMFSDIEAAVRWSSSFRIR